LAASKEVSKDQATKNRYYLLRVEQKNGLDISNYALLDDSKSNYEAKGKKKPVEDLLADYGPMLPTSTV
tara:strand:- start:248 stop:454 length:207 start_codon:yes stop_codon:yes gene_type:complete